MSSNRTGFTLFELLIAVAILGVLLAVAVPSLAALLERQQLQQVVGEVESFLLNQRATAVRTGTVRWVRYASLERMLISGADGQPVSESLELPEDFQFSRAGFVEKLDSETVGELGITAVNLNWSPELWFYSDGTSEDGRFALENRERPLFAVEIRGLTGQISVRRLAVGEELPE